jgi:hypothetical protein
VAESNAAGMFIKTAAQLIALRTVRPIMHIILINLTCEEWCNMWKPKMNGVGGILYRRVILYAL